VGEGAVVLKVEEGVEILEDLAVEVAAEVPYSAALVLKVAKAVVEVCCPLAVAAVEVLLLEAAVVEGYLMGAVAEVAQLLVVVAVDAV
jgi:hypothetical protein